MHHVSYRGQEPEREAVVEALNMSAIALGAAHGALQQEVDQRAPGHAGVGLAGAALLLSDA